MAAGKPTAIAQRLGYLVSRWLAGHTLRFRGWTL